MLLQQIGSYEKTSSYLLDELDKVKSAPNRAALMAPREESALVMQRMEDSGLRQLSRLTEVLFKVRSGALAIFTHDPNVPAAFLHQRGDQIEIEPVKVD